MFLLFLQSVVSDEQSIDSLNNDEANSIQHSSKLPQNLNSIQHPFKLPQNFEKPVPAKLSRFWLFIDKNGETKPLVPPPLSVSFF